MESHVAKHQWLETLERFAFSPDRAAVVSSLIPGRFLHLFFSALQAIEAGDTAEARALIATLREAAGLKPTSADPASPSPAPLRKSALKSLDASPKLSSVTADAAFLGPGGLVRLIQELELRLAVALWDSGDRESCVDIIKKELNVTLNTALPAAIAAAPAAPATVPAFDVTIEDAEGAVAAVAPAVAPATATTGSEAPGVGAATAAGGGSGGVSGDSAAGGASALSSFPSTLPPEFADHLSLLELTWQKHGWQGLKEGGVAPVLARLLAKGEAEGQGGGSGGGFGGASGRGVGVGALVGQATGGGMEERMGDCKEEDEGGWRGGWDTQHQHVYPSIPSHQHQHVYPSIPSHQHQHVYPSIPSHQHQHVYSSIPSHQHQHVYPSIPSHQHQHVYFSIPSHQHQHVYPSIPSHQHQHVYSSIPSHQHQHVYPSIPSHQHQHVYPSIPSHQHQHVYPSIPSHQHQHVYPSIPSHQHQHVYPSIPSHQHQHVYPSIPSHQHQHVYPSIPSHQHQHVYPSIPSHQHQHVYPSIPSHQHQHVYPSIPSHQHQHVYPSIPSLAAAAHHPLCPCLHVRHPSLPQIEDAVAWELQRLERDEPDAFSRLSLPILQILTPPQLQSLAARFPSLATHPRMLALQAIQMLPRGMSLDTSAPTPESVDQILSYLDRIQPLLTSDHLKAKLLFARLTLSLVHGQADAALLLAFLSIIHNGPYGVFPPAKPHEEEAFAYFPLFASCPSPSDVKELVAQLFRNLFSSPSFSSSLTSPPSSSSSAPTSITSRSMFHSTPATSASATEASSAQFPFAPDSPEAAALVERAMHTWQPLIKQGKLDWSYVALLLAESRLCCGDDPYYPVWVHLYLTSYQRQHAPDNLTAGSSALAELTGRCQLDFADHNRRVWRAADSVHLDVIVKNVPVLA
ncbi:unnamed protein product, partial [Closterium sp. Yama58-4]